jgi:hypothetical protein
VLTADEAQAVFRDVLSARPEVVADANIPVAADRTSGGPPAGCSRRSPEVPALTFDDLRHLVIGRIADKHWSAVIASRGERRRIFSVRRSRVEEVAIHEGA